jgi:hypothetical protein
MTEIPEDRVDHNDVARCELCGEAMPPGEEMFKFHGYSGDCPKPPLPTSREVVAKYIFRDASGKFFIDIQIDDTPYSILGPFDTSDERQRAYDDLLDMMRQTGARDVK